MERKQNEGQHEYLVEPTTYQFSDNNNHSTYDQFIQLRDTLVFTGKKYAGKAGLKLAVGEKEETIEVVERQLFKQTFQPTWKEGNVVTEVIGKNVTVTTGELSGLYGPLSCIVNKDGRYRIVHKEEVLVQATQNKVYCYVDIYRKGEDGQYKIAYPGGVAVFDWKGGGTLTGTTSGTQPNGTCSITFTLGQLINKMTAFGFMERDLYKGDIVVMRMKDAENGEGGVPAGNDLTLQADSNFWSIEYLDLPYNK